MNRLSPSPVSIQQAPSTCDLYAINDQHLNSPQPVFLDFIQVGKQSSINKDDAPQQVKKDAVNGNSTQEDETQRCLAQPSATIVIDMSSSSSSFSQSCTQESMSQSRLQVKYRPGSATIGKLATSSDSLDTEYSPDEEESQPQCIAKKISIKGILKKDGLNCTPKGSRHVHFDGDCILASRCVKLTPEEQPITAIQWAADDDTDQDEADDEDYEESEADDDDDDSNATDDDSDTSDSTESEQESDSLDKDTEASCTDTIVISLFEDDGTDVETDFEEIARLNMLQNKELVRDQAPSAISITEEPCEEGFTPAGSLLSIGGIPPSSPESPETLKHVANSFSEETDGLQSFAVPRNGNKRIHSSVKMNVFYPQPPVLKKRCLGTRKSSNTQADLDTAATAAATKKIRSGLYRGPPSKIPPVAGRRSPSRVL